MNTPLCPSSQVFGKTSGIRYYNTRVVMWDNITTTKQKHKKLFEAYVGGGTSVGVDAAPFPPSVPTSEGLLVSSVHAGIL